MKIIIHLPPGFHVYNVREAKYLGQTASLSTTLNPWEPLVLTLSSTAVEGLSLQTPAEAVRGKPAEVTLILRDEPKGPQQRVVRLEVFDPAGRLLEHYCSNLRFAGEQSRVEIPFAWNDPSGNWKLCAQDIASGASDEATLTLN